MLWFTWIVRSPTVESVDHTFDNTNSLGSASKLSLFGLVMRVRTWTVETCQLASLQAELALNSWPGFAVRWVGYDWKWSIPEALICHAFYQWQSCYNRILSFSHYTLDTGRLNEIPSSSKYYVTLIWLRSFCCCLYINKLVCQSLWNLWHYVAINMGAFMLRICHF